MSLDLFKHVGRFARAKSAMNAQPSVAASAAQDRDKAWSRPDANVSFGAPNVRIDANAFYTDTLPSEVPCEHLGENIASILAVVPKRARRALHEKGSEVAPVLTNDRPHESPPTIAANAPSSVVPAVEPAVVPSVLPSVLPKIALQEKANITLVVSADMDGPAGAAALKFGRQIVRNGRALLLNLERGDADAGLGLSDLLSGKATFTDVIRRDDASRLHVIELGQGAVMLGEAFDLIIEALAQTYSFLIINGGAAEGAVSDALARTCDTAVISASQAVRTGRLDMLRDRLRTAGAPEVVDMPIIDDETRQAA